MVQVTICDCGKQTVLRDGEAVLLGIQQLTYCLAECSGMVREFLDARDKLHDAVVKKWEKDMKALHKKYPDFRMPDEYPLSR